MTGGWPGKQGYRGEERTRDGVVERRCRKCRRWYERANFRRDSSCIGGLSWECLPCYKLRHDRYVK